MTRNVRSHVYRAEHALEFVLDRQHEAPLIQIHGTTLTVPMERKFANIESIQEYCNRVLDLQWIKQTYPRSMYPVTVRVRQGQAQAHYERAGYVIAVPPWNPASRKAWAMREFVILHEVAHHLDTSLEDHGPEFTGILVHLVSELIGPEAGLILRMSYYDEGVKVG